MSRGTVRRALAGTLAVLATMSFNDLSAAQQTGVIEGVVTTVDALVPLNGVRVTVAGTRLGVFTNESGAYRLVGVPPGDVEVVTEYIGHRVARRTVTVSAGESVRADFELDVQAIPAGEIVVTASGETTRRSETAASVSVITESTIEQVQPSHPSEIMNRVAGVWVNVTGGEGHMTAIRQPLTTNPVYLYAEDGVPTRSTGFFNHNALYEIDVPDARRIEVVKGPATALYGSDAIGGTINVVTRGPSDGMSVSAEGGSWGFGRIRASAGAVRANDGYLAQLNITRTDGWRDGTAYDRQSGTIRYDRDFGGGSALRTVVTFSRIDQNTAGSSAVSADDYADQPEINYTPISYRKIKALRLHSEYERPGERSSLTITPFARWNEMDILPNWSLTFDPAIWTTGHASLGALVRYRRDFEPWRTRLIAGTDFDWSPGHHSEIQIAPARIDGIFESYTDGETIYDYDVTFASASPYLQAEVSPLTRMRVTAGLRFDAMRYDYDNRLGDESTGRYRRPASTSVDFTHLSPKLGATFALSERVNVYGAWSHGFRVPSEGQLFRQGRADNTVELIPVKADNLEGGIRMNTRQGLSVDVAIYSMTKTDDILTLTNPDGSTQTANAGETLHRGIEFGAGIPIGDRLRLDANYSIAGHTYEDWRPTASVDYGGNDMEDGPRQLGHASLSWRPAFIDGSSLAVEWQRVGKYWMDADNTHRYPGHDLFGLRLSVPVRARTTVFARLTNLTNERYAESSAYTIARGEEFAPGLPRAFYLGIRIR
jgi:outer membrane receptor protein involved in Fe transport